MNYEEEITKLKERIKTLEDLHPKPDKTIRQIEGQLYQISGDFNKVGLTWSEAISLTNNYRGSGFLVILDYYHKHS